MPEIPPHKSKSARNAPQPLAVQGTENLPNPFQTDDPGASGTKVALRTEEEQQAAAREREEKEKAKEKEVGEKEERETRGATGTRNSTGGAAGANVPKGRNGKPLGRQGTRYDF